MRFIVAYMSLIAGYMLPLVGPVLAILGKHIFRSFVTDFLQHLSTFAKPPDKFSDNLLQLPLPPPLAPPVLDGIRPGVYADYSSLYPHGSRSWPLPREAKPYTRGPGSLTVLATVLVWTVMGSRDIASGLLAFKRMLSVATRAWLSCWAGMLSIIDAVLPFSLIFLVKVVLCASGTSGFPLAPPIYDAQMADGVVSFATKSMAVRVDPLASNTGTPPVAAQLPDPASEPRVDSPSHIVSPVRDAAQDASSGVDPEEHSDKVLAHQPDSSTQHAQSATLVEARQTSVAPVPADETGSSRAGNESTPSMIQSSGLTGEENSSCILTPVQRGDAAEAASSAPPSPTVAGPAVAQLQPGKRNDEMACEPECLGAPEIKADMEHVVASVGSDAACISSESEASRDVSMSGGALSCAVDPALIPLPQSSSNILHLSFASSSSSMSLASVCGGILYASESRWDPGASEVIDPGDVSFLSLSSMSLTSVHGGILYVSESMRDLDGPDAAEAEGLFLFSSGSMLSNLDSCDGDGSGYLGDLSSSSAPFTCEFGGMLRASDSCTDIHAFNATGSQRCLDDLLDEEDLGGSGASGVVDSGDVSFLSSSSMSLTSVHGGILYVSESQTGLDAPDDAESGDLSDLSSSMSLTSVHGGILYVSEGFGGFDGRGTAGFFSEESSNHSSSSGSFSLDSCDRSDSEDASDLSSSSVSHSLDPRDRSDTGYLADLSLGFSFRSDLYDGSDSGDLSNLSSSSASSACKYGGILRASEACTDFRALSAIDSQRSSDTPDDEAWVARHPGTSAISYGAEVPHRKDDDQVTRIVPSASDDTLPAAAQVGDGTSGSTPDIQGPPTEFQSIVKRVEKGEKLSGELGFIGSGLGKEVTAARRLDMVVEYIKIRQANRERESMQQAEAVGEGSSPPLGQRARPVEFGTTPVP